MPQPENHRCKDCSYSERIAREFDCRFDPPVVLHEPDYNSFAVWPRVEPDDWCGKFLPARKDAPKESQFNYRVGDSFDPRPKS